MTFYLQECIIATVNLTLIFPMSTLVNDEILIHKDDYYIITINLMTVPELTN